MDDFSISYKNRFVESKEKRPSLAVIAATTLPTGAREIGENHLQPQIALEAQGDFSDKLSWNLDGVYTRASDDGQQFDQGASGATLNYAATKALTFFAETYLLTQQGSGQSYGADGGVTYLLGRNTQLDFSFGHGLNGVGAQDSANSFVAFGIAQRF